jgi:2-keto-4-pentenoate hydratase
MIMPPTLDLHAAARRIKSAQDAARQIEPLAGQIAGFDMPAAYAVAHLVHEARLAEGIVPVGRKLGFTNPAMWTRYGVAEPVWAYVYDTTVAYLPAAGGTCSIGRLLEPKIEPEIVFHFRSAPPIGGDLKAILACIDWVAHAFEIVHCHYPAWTFQAADAVADGAFHGALLMGERQPVDRLGLDPIAALESLSIALSCNGDVREVGRGSNVLGSPLVAVAHLIAVLEKQPQYMPLQANEIVTTGTVTAAHSVQVGETWSTEVQGIALPGLSVELVA